LSLKHTVENILLNRGGHVTYPALRLGSGWTVEDATDGGAIVHWRYDRASGRVTELKEALLAPCAYVIAGARLRVTRGREGDESFLKVWPRPGPTRG
jgi:hypothetical protein